MLLAALAGEHLLLLGPPGTAKSELSRRMAKLVGGTYFERLLTRCALRTAFWLKKKQNKNKKPASPKKKKKSLSLPGSPSPRSSSARSR